MVGAGIVVATLSRSAAPSGKSKSPLSLKNRDEEEKSIRASSFCPSPRSGTSPYGWRALSIHKAQGLSLDRAHVDRRLACSPTAKHICCAMGRSFARWGARWKRARARRTPPPILLRLRGGIHAARVHRSTRCAAALRTIATGADLAAMRPPSCPLSKAAVPEMVLVLLVFNIHSRALRRGSQRDFDSEYVAHGPTYSDNVGPAGHAYRQSLARRGCADGQQMITPRSRPRRQGMTAAGDAERWSTTYSCRKKRRRENERLAY